MYPKLSDWVCSINEICINLMIQIKYFGMALKEEILSNQSISRFHFKPY